MRFSARTFLLARDAESPGACQDSFDIDPERGSAAIADGVSATLFAGPWARILTKATIAQAPNLEDPAAFGSWLSELRSEWVNTIDTSKLNYFQRMKMREMTDGAMSTLLWVDFPPIDAEQSAGDGEYQINAYSIGDCSLFQVRDGQCLSSFPMTSSAEFGLSPDVIGSIDRKHDHLLNFKAKVFTCRPGDLLVLCTDAIGQWALTRAEANEPVDWDRYWDLPDESWREEIFSLRQASLMRVDDTTLVLLRVSEVASEVATPEPSPGDSSAEPFEADESLELTPEEPVDSACAGLSECDDPVAEDDAILVAECVYTADETEAPAETAAPMIAESVEISELETVSETIGIVESSADGGGLEKFEAPIPDPSTVESETGVNSNR